jgi:hypothetical protein
VPGITRDVQLREGRGEIRVLRQEVISDKSNKRLKIVNLPVLIPGGIATLAAVWHFRSADEDSRSWGTVGAGLGRLNLVLRTHLQIT